MFEAEWQTRRDETSRHKTWNKQEQQQLQHVFDALIWYIYRKWVGGWGWVESQQQCHHHRIIRADRIKTSAAEEMGSRNVFGDVMMSVLFTFRHPHLIRHFFSVDFVLNTFMFLPHISSFTFHFWLVLSRPLCVSLFVTIYVPYIPFHHSSRVIHFEDWLRNTSKCRSVDDASVVRPSAVF